jgi:hypothetical protein
MQAYQKASWAEMGMSTWTRGMRASAVLVLVLTAGAYLMSRPALWPWVAGVGALHAVLAIASGWAERKDVLGQPWTVATTAFLAGRFVAPALVLAAAAAAVALGSGLNAVIWLAVMTALFSLG